MGLDAVILVFWILSFKPTFSLSSFTFIKRLFSSSLLSAIRVVSSAYLRLLIFLPAILIPACASSSPAFHMMYAAYKLDKQGDNIQPCHTPFSLLSQSIVPYKVLIVASWPVYRFLRKQVRWSDIPISLRVSTVCYDPHSQRLRAVNETEVDVLFFFFPGIPLLSLFSIVCVYKFFLKSVVSDFHQHHTHHVDRHIHR